jgi:hypothetical protein
MFSSREFLGLSEGLNIGPIDCSYIKWIDLASNRNRVSRLSTCVLYALVAKAEPKQVLEEKVRGDRPVLLLKEGG